ncbi:uncharacterized protein LOC1274831 isoform X1 [Anopheles gambiae]|uniref:uncharacterized protein LOC1274831 isoform X1 n=1 Tax=Anopheles gambiae TaxID=7165 RepID=UPI002AC9C73D|nr:uncharacterized protein LOC1274831 isoform X1 [Anopheles gambiae]
MRTVGGTVAGKHTDTKNHTMVHSGAIVPHYLLRPSSSAAVAAAARVATVLLDHQSSSSSSKTTSPRLLQSVKPCVHLPSTVPPQPSERALVAASRLLASSCLSPNVWLSQPKSMSILIVLKGGQSTQRYSREEATRKKGRLIYEAHSPYRSAAAVRKVPSTSKIDRRQQNYCCTRLLEGPNEIVKRTAVSLY